MSKTNWQDPGSGEIRSTHMSGLQEAVGKIEQSIGIQAVSELDIPLSEVFISNDDRSRIYQAPEGQRNWLSSPAPVIKQNGVTITADFEIDYGGGAIIFNTPILETDIMTADVSHTSQVLNKQLSSEDYSTADKNKLAGIESEANKYILPETLPANMIIMSGTDIETKVIDIKQDLDSHLLDIEKHMADIQYLKVRGIRYNG
ncbi:hypothetical protein CLHUN_02050 [Ruminiclostridium hungatei]|uniref:Uncharacterized protein n=1 Tax=Ruminiclostridium hungatei TaxID=48256 RepID=A0A1V4SR61_RUMHU|nr:hypothetical protein [Ruminiclostridium hungatei]OPX46389.1 hypothetical protein CLHUN_02050 [Ruminiclostridium hungatei]